MQTEAADVLSKTTALRRADECRAAEKMLTGEGKRTRFKVLVEDHRPVIFVGMNLLAEIRTC